MKREAVRAYIEDIGIVPSVRVKSKDLARFAAETVYDAGIPIVEITLTTPGGLDVVRDLAKSIPKLAVGAGTVLDEETAKRAVDAGACFLSSPGFVPEVVAYANRTDLAVFPGALTPTEVIAAWKAGSDFVKVFPAAHVGGVQYIRSLKVPLPQIPIIVGGGVNQLTATEYIVAGATALGIGAELLPAGALRNRQVHWISELARRFITMVKDGRMSREGLTRALSE
jgi:2-dehydro-3-deoxyphosphogluconate aldolase / (4S)-4-hydroxy-2-oxoglutarate aldolase